MENSWHCFQCSSKPPKYNPFSTLLHDKYDPNSLADVEDLHEISKILENCSKHSIKSFNKLSKQLHSKNDRIFSCLFNNIDGCASNFDMFVSSVVSQYKNLFSVIGIAETNIDQCHKELYKLNNYTSEFNDKLPGKMKGSGIGLYIHNDYLFNRLDELSQCSKNLETLFITIINTPVPITVGVVYRPPSGSIKEFLLEWENILDKLPESNVHLMGDLNIDLLKQNEEFETTFYSKNLIPLISEATHEKPGCTPSLIDNIFINCSENLLHAGILENKSSHHSPIFCFMNHFIHQRIDDDVKCPKYDYCDSKIDDFLQKLDTSVLIQGYTSSAYDTETFTKFVEGLKNEIELHFRVEEQEFKKSRRNFYVNPWITPGLKASIAKKHFYYKMWKKTQTKTNPLGNDTFYIRFKSYRKYLKKLIKLAKKNFYCKKFENVHGNLKKTWALINELRGKNKSNIKASFVFNGKLVEDRRQISNEFNNYFASVAKKLNAKTNSSTLNEKSNEVDFQSYLRNRIHKNIFLSPTSSCEIEDIVQSLENGKASDIAILILKRCIHIISGHLSSFFNNFITFGRFPDILKVGKITPIYKNGDPSYLKITDLYL